VGAVAGWGQTVGEDRRICRRLHAMTLGNWQRHMKAGATVRPAGDIDATVVGHDDFLNEGEAETGAVLLRGEKGAEDLFACVGVDSGAIVLHRHARDSLSMVDRPIDTYVGRDTMPLTRFD